MRDAKTAGQVTGSEQRFTRLGDYQLLLLSGYAIIDSAAFPIVGDPKKAYDTYLEQLVDDARAAVDKAVEMGVVDRDRIGVTGHSHGALMTANLIAHTDLFRAGAATSGSYNKTLTPFEEASRTGASALAVVKGWNVYLKVSPFFVADKIKLPLLIVHGVSDVNADLATDAVLTPGREENSTKRSTMCGNGGTSRLYRDVAARAALVFVDGVQRAARVRGAAVVRQVRQARAGERGPRAREADQELTRRFVR